VARGPGASAEDPYAETEKECERLWDEFAARYTKACPLRGRDAVPGLGADGDLLPLPDGPLDTPPDDEPGVGSPPAAVQLRRDAAKRYKKVANTEALILEDPEDRREEVPPSQLAKVLLEAAHREQKFLDGIVAEESRRMCRAA